MASVLIWIIVNAGRQRKKGDRQQMGMDAELFGLGRFKRSIVGHLDYPEDFYEDTPEDCEILTLVFSCNTAQSSEDLARCLEIDPWKFESHRLTLTDQILEDLKAFAKEYSMQDSWEDLEALAKAGFTFQYMPNG